MSAPFPNSYYYSWGVSWDFLFVCLFASFGEGWGVRGNLVLGFFWGEGAVRVFWFVGGVLEMHFTQHKTRQTVKNI